MKRTLAIMAVLGMSTAISGCFLSSEDQPAAAPAQAQASPLWKLSLQSKCAGDAADCVAAYGFAITADGKYMVGPTPAGQTATGSLKPEELKYLNEKIEALTATAPASHPNGDEAAPAEGTAEAATAAPQEACEALVNTDQDQLILTQQGKEKILAQTRNSQLCFQTANNEAASELHQAVKELAAAYYPTPFPNACVDQVSALQSLYATVQSCSADTDCTFVDQSFAAIPASSDQWVTTNAGTQVMPLAVASTSALASHRDALNQAYNSALSACHLNANAGSAEGFMTTSAAPRCQQGVCRITAAAAAAPAAEANPAPAASAAPAAAPAAPEAPAAPAAPGAGQ
ncbi:MAG: hypothetical protein ACJ763_17025 [Bdellovibrionia bacterium]